jgi:hypothetical protein
MRNVKRKTVLNMEKAAQLLIKVMEEKADEDGLPIADPDSFPKREAYLEESTVRLSKWLDFFEKEGDSFGYSMLLQLWLALNNIPCPKDVFTQDFESKGRGRPASELGELALDMHKPNEFGRGKIAKELLRDDYDRDPETTVKRIKDLAETARKGRDLVGDALADAQAYGFLLLGAATWTRRG